jgi:DNA-binding MarR family transcriptional regulator
LVTLNSFNSYDKARFPLTLRIKNPLDLLTHLPFKFAVVTNLLQLNKDASIKNITQLEPREFRVLLNIGSYMPIKSADIAYLGRLDSYTVSRAVKELMKQALISVEIYDKNLKIKNLVLTDKGISVYEKLCWNIHQRTDVLESVLSESEKTELMRLLELLESQSEAMIANYAINEKEMGKEPSADQKEIIRWYKKSRAASDSAN